MIPPMPRAERLRAAARSARPTCPALYLLINDRSLQGDYLALPLRSEPSFRKEFMETGFLGDTRGRFLVTDLRTACSARSCTSTSTSWTASSGYQLFETAARNKGLMSEAVAMTVDYLFTQHKINRLQIVTAPDNEPSNGWR